MRLKAFFNNTKYRNKAHYTHTEYDMEIETKSFSRHHWNVNYKQTTLSYL